MALTFRQRSGRVIALCRAVLAGLFLLAIWIDPTQPVRATGLSYALLIAYLWWSIVLCAVVLKSWWWDESLAIAAYVIDCVVFLLAVVFTESTNTFFVSPFMAFFAFLMLGATIRWDWRVTATAALSLCTAYLATGLVMDVLSFDFDGYRFSRRVTYMVVLALVLVWFGINRGSLPTMRFEPSIADPLPDNHAAFGAILPIVAKHLHARRIACAWSEREEPWIHLLRCDEGSQHSDRLGPEAEGNLSVHPFDDFMLVDIRRGRSLALDEGDRAKLSRRTIALPLAGWTGWSEGITFPVNSSEIEGRVYISGIAGVAADDLRASRSLKVEIESFFARQHVALLIQREGNGRVRNALARDLHDTVAQILAGVDLRLSSLQVRQRVRNEDDTDIASARAALASEEATIRAVISRLRGDVQYEVVSLGKHLCDVSRFLASNWDLKITISPEVDDIAVSNSFAFEIGQLLREAAANAVRHGQAKRLTIEGGSDDAGIRLSFADDGDAKSNGAGPLQPRSLNERTRDLGGSLEVQSDAVGTTLHFIFQRRTTG